MSPDEWTEAGDEGLLRLAADMAPGCGRGRGRGSLVKTSAVTHPSELGFCVTDGTDSLSIRSILQWWPCQ